jgi:PKHD-type hydroxylase
MFLLIKALLNAQEVARLTELSQEMALVEGRLTNLNNPTKQNLQAHRDPNDTKYAESVQIVSVAFSRSREFRDFALPKRMSHPLLSRYDAGMRYGAHADAAHLPIPPNIVLRTDLSATVFIADPASYEGGELAVHLGGQTVTFKGDSGDAVVYPSTKLHEVAPVRSGSRLVSVVFIESMISDEHKRTQLYELNEVAALEGKNMSWENRVRFEVARNNLMRMWSDV